MPSARGAIPSLMLALTLLGGLLAVAPPVHAQEPLPDSLPSFSESPGCGALDGFRGPLAPAVGFIPLATPVYGPWGDFYGRTVALVRDQVVAVQLPGQSKTLYVHQRVLPAFNAVVANLNAEEIAGNTYPISTNTWSLNQSTIPPTRKFSFHTVGAAIDVNSTTNPYSSQNVLITDMPTWFVDAWREAGWCWGGDWQTIKDPMHYSWMGPLYTPGYVMPPPQPPLVAAAPFTAAMAIYSALPPGTAGTEIVADMDRDGAVDVVRLETLADTGQVILRAAVARNDFEACTPISVTEQAPTDPAATAFLEDFSADGRPDLAYADTSGPMLAFEVFTLAHGEAMARSIRSTAVAVAAGDTYRFDDHDRDGAIDLYVIRDGDPASLEIWLGPTFDSMALSTDLGVASAGHRFDVADRDFDGLPDVYAFSAGGSLVVHPAATGFTAAAPLATGVSDAGDLSLHDLDGDGHPDTFVLAADGSVSAWRGGASTHDPGVWYELPELGWVPGSGCSTPYPRCDDLPATVIGSDEDDLLWGSDGINVVWAGAGNDEIVTMGGDDRICAGPGDDDVSAGDGKDVARGGAGNDVLRGGQASDRLTGGEGDDALYGDNGTRDRLIGGLGKDWINGGPGSSDRCTTDGDDHYPTSPPNCEIVILE